MTNIIKFNRVSNIAVFIRNASQFQKSFKLVPKINDEIFQRLQIDDINNNNFRNLRIELIKNYKHINEINVDTTIIGNLNKSLTDLKLARRYIEFLKADNLTVNTATLGKLIKTYYLNYCTYQGGKIPENIQNEIINIYNEILSRSQIVEPVTCANLIYGIILTDQWKDSLKLLDMIMVVSTPPSDTLSVICARAFKENEKEIGWNMLEKLINFNKQPKCDIFIKYFDLISKEPTHFLHNLERMLNFIGKSELIISKNVIQKLQEVLKNINVDSNLTELYKNGKCAKCGQFSERIHITSKEFNQLRNSFLDKVLVRKDVFLKSSPEEIKKFSQFLDIHAPFHCVIDGLNVAYSGGKLSNHFSCSNLLKNVVQYFAEKNKKVVVIGRKHMERWHKPSMNYIKNNSKLFLANDLSHDDPFILYAALKSGPATDFVTRDLMRPYSFLLGQDLKIIFKKWQLEHQFSLIAASREKVVVKEPIKFKIWAHKIQNSWHIPFREEYTAMPEESFNIPNNWLCFSTKI